MKRRKLTNTKSVQDQPENRAKKIKKKHKSKKEVEKPFEVEREESQTAQREPLQPPQLSIVQTNPQTQVSSNEDINPGESQDLGGSFLEAMEVDMEDLEREEEPLRKGENENQLAMFGGKSRVRKITKSSFTLIGQQIIQKQEIQASFDANQRYQSLLEKLVNPLPQDDKAFIKQEMRGIREAAHNPVGKSFIQWLEKNYDKINDTNSTSEFKEKAIDLYVHDKAIESEKEKVDSINLRYWYQDNDISDYVDAVIKHSLGGYRKDCHSLLAGIGDGCFPDNDNNRYFVAVTPAIDTVGHAAPLDSWLDKSKQPEPVGKQDDRRDVWDEIWPVISKQSSAHVKILFGYNDTLIHWLLGEIQLHKTKNQYTVIFMAHDPYGGGGMDENNFTLLSAAIQQEILKKDSSAHVECKRQPSPYGRRQSRGDLNSCGVIVSEDMLKRISGASLDQKEPYPLGTETLRRNHLQVFKDHFPENDATRKNFIKRITQKSVAESPRLFPSTTSHSEKTLLDLTKMVSLITGIQHVEIKQRIIGAITHSVYYEDQSAYRVGVETALLQWPVELLSQGEQIDYQDKLYINELYYHLFLNKEGFQGQATLIHGIASQLAISQQQEGYKTATLLSEFSSVYNTSINSESAPPAKRQKTEMENESKPQAISSNYETVSKRDNEQSTPKKTHPLALPLAQLYQRLAFIRLPVFKKPQPLCHSYVHLMLIDQHTGTARPQLLAQSTSETTEHLSTPWLNRYRSYEDIYHVQKAVAPESLCQATSRAIVIGRAGVGKSTFCRYGLYRWSLNFKKDTQEAAKDLTPWWTQYDLVFWIPLRSLLSYQSASKVATETINEIELAALIMHLFTSQPEITKKDVAPFTHEVLVQVLQTKTLNILYLLDGFDEAERLQTKNTYGKRLLDYLLHQDCYVLTSRPHALEGAMAYQSDNTAYYELMGFDNEDIPEYVERAFKLNERPGIEKEQLLERLKMNITMWTAAHTPIQLALLCALWKDDLIPRQKTVTLTGLYTILLERLLGYNLQQLLHSSPLEAEQKQAIAEQYKRSKALAQLLKPLYRFLSKIAFISLMQDALILSEDFLLEQLEAEDVAALKTFLITLGYKDVLCYGTSTSFLPWVGRLGILHAIPVGERNDYEFIHLTFQEYLAAYYLTERFITGEKITYADKANVPYSVDTLIPQLADNSAWQMTLSFMAGQLYTSAGPSKEKRLNAYMTLLANVPDSLLKQVTPSDKRFDWAQLLVGFSTLIKSNGTDITREMIHRALLLAYCLEECELADVSQKQSILVAMKASGTRALLFPLDFPTYSQERVNLVHALKLCQRVFAASGLRERLQHPEKEGISLPQILYLAQAALLQITERNTFTELITLLQKALDSNMAMVQLQIMEDILQWSTTYTHREEVVFALELCLCSKHTQVVDKAWARLEEINNFNKPMLLIKAARLNLSAKYPLIKRRAALLMLQNDFYAPKAWQNLMEALSSQSPSFLDDIHLKATDCEKIETFNTHELLHLAGKTFAWLLMNDISESTKIVLSLLTSVQGLQAVVQSSLIERSQRSKEGHIKRRIIELFEQLNLADDEVIQLLVTLLSEQDTLIRRNASALLKKFSKADAPKVVRAHIQNLSDSNAEIRQEAAEALIKLKKADAPEVVPALIKNLSEWDAGVRQAAAEALIKIGKADVPEVVQAHIQNLNHTYAWVRQTAAEALIKLKKADVPEVVPALIKNLREWDTEVRQAAAEALIKLKKADAPEVIQAHIKNLSHWDPEVSQEAAKALERLGRSDILELNRSLTFDPVGKTSQNTVQNLSPNNFLMTSTHKDIFSEIQNSKTNQENEPSSKLEAFYKLDQEQIQRYFNKELERQALSQSQEINTSSFADELIYPSESDEEEDSDSSSSLEP